MVKQRDALEQLWKSRCNIYKNKESGIHENGRTFFKEQLLYGNIPCHVSVDTVQAASDNGQSAVVSQSITLFIGNEYTVDPGCSISVNTEDRIINYYASGIPVIYTNHQEISLEIKEFA